MGKAISALFKLNRLLFFLRLLSISNSTKHRLIKNTLWLILAEGISKILMFLVTAYTARTLGVQGYGELSILLILSSLLSIIIDFGFNTLLVRDVAKNNFIAKEYIANIVILKVFASIIASIFLCTLISIFIPGSNNTTLLIVTSIYMIFQSYFIFYQSIFQALEQMKYILFVKVIYASSLFVFIYFFFSNGLDLQNTIMAYALSLLIGLAFSIYFQNRIVSISLQSFRFEKWYKLLVNALPFALSNAAIIIYYRIDIFLLGVLRSPEEVGSYSAAYNIIVMVIQLIVIVTAAFTPTLAKLYERSQSQFYSYTVELSEQLIIYAIPFILVIYSNSHLLIEMIYGYKFASGTPDILRILIWSVLILYGYALVGVGLNIMNKQTLYLKGVLLGVVANLCFNLLLIPAYGYYGAAIATIFTELTVGTYMVSNFLKNSQLNFNIGLIIKLSVAIISYLAVEFAFTYLIHMNFLLSSFMGIVTYIFVVKFLGIKVMGIQRIIKI